MNTPCPNEEAIADYLQGFLEDEQRFEMETHFADCEQCLDELMVLRAANAEIKSSYTESSPSRMVQHVVDLIQNQTLSPMDVVVRKIKRSATHFFLNTSDYLHSLFNIAPNVAAIRGSKKRISQDLIHLNISFQEIETIIEIEKIRDNTVNIRVELSGGLEKEKKIRVTLRREKRELSSYLLDHKKPVIFNDIPFGQYAMAFTRNGEEIGIYPFEIKETIDGK